ncbi:hypothetical protein [Oenococcus kitaharae]|uniref:Uncharacterized protein n=1 Tax=Oenococcus kitaharae DSM 17330 TaxID=1045004 RepID=G9WIR3_9LACO|nr:hypothetical protein [Oenococcus kitaharae]EHN58202.1 hypothetical protein OKIT_0073 [Oenococcus kitaharae DSM 17330]OEY81609.1 hypothetical protein NT95_08960 [Oenococcus kitaharae]OEY83094.1 hypothetical protein NV75_07060 [Oenococcus kitaharae]OEY84360.1 hypothetical protein NT96_03575 [Oenococcus kitaharae]
MRANFVFELKRILKRKKNRFAIGLFLILALIFAGFFSQTTFQGERVNQELLTQNNIYQIRTLRHVRAHNIPNPPVLAFYPQSIRLNTRRVADLQKHNWQQYARDSAAYFPAFIRWYQQGAAQNMSYPTNYGDTNTYPMGFVDSASYYYRYAASYYRAAANAKTVNRAVLEEASSAGSTLNFLKSDAMPVFFLLLIVIVCDQLVSDRKHRSIFLGQPVSLYRRTWSKTAAAISSWLILSVIAIALVAVINGLRFGFSDWLINHPLAHNGRFYPYFTQIQPAIELLEAIALLAILGILISRLAILLNLILKNEFLTALILAILVFFERAYWYPYCGIGGDYSIYPFPYFQVGRLVTGTQSSMYAQNGLTFAKGMLVTAAYVIVLEILIKIILLATKSGYLRRKS